jgi:hypothetical protein
MIVLVETEKMGGQLQGPAALRVLEDHASSVSGYPSDRISSALIASTAAQALASSSSSSGVSGSVPMFAAS